MSFAHPLALLLLLLLIPVGLLYRLRLRVPRVVVGTGPFWEKALAEEPLRTRWQPWRKPVSLVLQSLTVILLALAAAGPQIPPAQRIVLILDNSATMRATDVQPSRFDAAKEVARRMIDSLRWCDRMAVVVTNSASVRDFRSGRVVSSSHAPLEAQPFTTDKALLYAAVNSAQALAEPPAIELAVQVAGEIGPWDRARLPIGANSGVIFTPGMLPRDPAPPRILLLTDGCAGEAARKRNRAVCRYSASAPPPAIGPSPALPRDGARSSRRTARSFWKCRTATVRRPKATWNSLSMTSQSSRPHLQSLRMVAGSIYLT